MFLRTTGTNSKNISACKKYISRSGFERQLGKMKLQKAFYVTMKEIPPSEFHSRSSFLHSSDFKSPYPQRKNWQIQKRALLEKFGSSGWSPRKRLSPDALQGIRALHAHHPGIYTTSVLAHHFQVSPEAVRRILKSKWRATEEEEEKRLKRWDRRGEAIWGQMVEIGIKPPKKWRDMGVRKGQTVCMKDYNEKRSAWKHVFGENVKDRVLTSKLQRVSETTS